MSNEQQPAPEPSAEISTFTPVRGMYVCLNESGDFVQLSDYRKQQAELDAVKAALEAEKVARKDEEYWWKTKHDQSDEIEKLKQELAKGKSDDAHWRWLNERACCDGRECGCMGISRIDQMIGEEVMSRIDKLNSELAAAKQCIAANDAKELERKGNPFNSPQFELRQELAQARAALSDRGRALCRCYRCDVEYTPRYCVSCSVPMHKAMAGGEK